MTSGADGLDELEQDLKRVQAEFVNYKRRVEGERAEYLSLGRTEAVMMLLPLLDNIGRIGLGRSLRILRIVERMARESAEGQMLELTWIAQNAWEQRDSDYVRLVHKKTGWYSFIAPALAGAVVAGLDDARAQS